MEFFETVYLPRILNHAIIWFRYIDDVFCCWPLDLNLDEFIINLNSLVPSIKFTIESEVEGSISFLDLKIIRSQNCFKFDIFRKVTNTCSYIHFFSDHSRNVKTSVFASMFLRALRIVDPEFLDGEINKIFEIGDKLCYPINFLDLCFEKAKKTFYNVYTKAPFECKNLLKLPFCQSFEGLAPLLQRLGIKLVFVFNNTIRHALIKNSPKNSPGVVYSIPCRTCDLVYIGQTGKTLEDRKKGHKTDCDNHLLSNSLFFHIYNKNHAIDWQHATNIIYNNDYIERNLLECVCIGSCDRLNLSPGMFSIDRITADLIRRQYPVLRFEG
jgi:hypothetical protein